ncbi:protocadherin-11 x-linked [Plakobranchus ocellatus]|uniref:Protocadherin-11 x-linked n=1 Tax=Plakobranchus ocellatus TaxID=259542 RepID=A0AAV3YGU2_9GAST|nr:protocadherin-11 x-linked [Plakobranchus ocellatus]
MARNVVTFMLRCNGPRLVFLLLICCIKPSITNAQFKLKASISFSEEQIVGAYVGNVVVASKLPDHVNQDELSRLEYRLQDSEDDYFDISKERGTLSSAKVIDRDAICEGEDECPILVEVLVYKMEAGIYDLFKIIDVTVEITDINDNPPEFPAKSVSLSVPENNALDEELRTSSAEDKDNGENGVKSYSFQDPTDTFTLKVHTNQDGSTYLGIVIKEQLDREVRDFYQVVIVATDGGTDPRLTGSAVINITVTDLNDNDPVFEKSAYNVSVPEDINVKVPIVHLKATDKDIGSNAEISYQISPQVSAEIRRIFYIDEQTGEIFCNSNLDYEVDRRYQLVVEAVDHGSPQKSSRVSVTLNVADVNDNSPQININLPPQGTDISEAEPVGKFIIHVTVSDRDQGENRRVTCSLNDDHFSLEKFGDDNSDMFKVVLARPLDHEKAPSHRVNISCTDHGQPPRSNSTTFVINVSDVNDVRPAFEEDTYRGSIPENYRGTREVLTVKARDWDSGDMGRITYSLEDRYNGLFVVDPDNGVISVTRPVDRENGAARLEFHVIARDNGKERLTSSALVIVEVEDENDEPPRFTRASFFGEVLENQPVGTSVGNVTATDPDSAPNGKIRYAILPQGTDFGKFSINSDTGEIKSADVFDRELKDRYFVTVQAVDPDKSEFYSTCNFTVRILDDNDHDPVITGIHSNMPTVEDFEEDINNATFIVQYTAPVGSIITRVMAHDGDEISSPNAQLYYAISSGDPGNLFGMNRFTGAIVLSRIVTAEDIKTFKLLITVSDGGDPPQSDSQYIYIKVNGSVAALTSSSSSGLSQNILIVIILIGVTIFLALAIFATICLIRKIDRQRRMTRANQKLSEDKMYQLTIQSNSHGHNNHQDVFANRGPLEREDEDRGRMSPGVANSGSYSNNLSKRGGGGGVGGAGKKEVSFSLDEESDSHNTSSGSGHPLTSFKNGGGARAGDKIDGVSTHLGEFTR